MVGTPAEKTFVFRCDASPDIGTGHAMRCLTMANELSSHGRIVFLCSSETPDTVPVLADSGFDIRHDDEAGSADWLIVDHYGLDKSYESAARQWAHKILVIDDLTNRSHECDILIDQTYGRNSEDYKPLVPAHCKILTGSDYAMLRPQFAAMRPKAFKYRKEKAGKVDRILVSLGGTNIYNITTMALKALDKFEEKPLSIDVVLGQNSPHIGSVEAVIRKIQKRGFHTIEHFYNVKDMALLMVEADLSIGAGGTSSWERCCLGLPTIMVEVADNQKEVAKALHQAGAVYNLGWYKNISVFEMADSLCQFTQNPALVKKLSNNAFKICNGRGTDYLLPHFFEEIIAENIISLRLAKMEDAQVLFEWQKAPETRKYFRTARPPSWAEHKEWVRKVVQDPSHYIYIIEYNEESAGVVRLDMKTKEHQDIFEVSILLAPKFKRKGVAAAALNIVKKLKPNSVLYAEVYAENEPSVRLFTKAGFQPEENNWYRYSPFLENVQ